MKRRPLVFLVLFGLAALLSDQALSRFYLPTYWRPLPPFGPLTNAKQEEWLQRKLARIETVDSRSEADEPRGKPEADSTTGMYDPLLGWTNRPDSASPDGDVSFNSRGWRAEHEYPELPAAGTTRVATFGDSFTFCQEVPDAGAWQAILEKNVADLEVLNLGVGGFGTDQALLRARRELSGLHAHVAWMGLLLENIGRNVNRYRPLWYPLTDVAVAKPRFVLADGRLELVEIPFHSEDELIFAIRDGSVLERLAEHEFWSATYVPEPLRWSAIARLLGGRRAYADRQLDRLWSDTQGEPFQVTLALLEDFVRLARESGAERVAILVFAMEQDQARWKRDGKRYWAPLFEELERREIPFVDLTAPLGEAYEPGEDSPLFSGTHHSHKGNAIIAQALAQWLQS